MAETDSDTVEAEGASDEEATASLDSATKDADESFSQDREVESSEEPCPLAKSITGRFEALTRGAAPFLMDFS